MDKNAEKVLFTLDEKFKFSCHNRLACFKTCCSDINIFLTPYDVLRMKNAAGLSSEEFLDKYTMTFVGEDGIPLVLLKMKEDSDKTCPFVVPEGCGIYQDRPWSCRMFPVFPLSSEEKEFLIEEKANCLGFKEDRHSTVREWKTDQGIDIYDRMNALYKDITHHDFFETGNKLDQGKTRALRRACYELTEFRRFLFSSRFFEIYDVEPDVIEKIKTDDVELLNFSYRWVRFSLFSEDTLKLKDKGMEKLMQSARESS